jgi:hypothetical protein
MDRIEYVHTSSHDYILTLYAVHVLDKKNGKSFQTTNTILT